MLTIYHTNSLKGNRGPVYKNQGGLSAVNTQVKNEADAGLLLDAGNFFKTRMGFERQKSLGDLMNSTGYTAAGISGIDLSDGGIMLTKFAPHFQFPLINCNHLFTPEVKSFIKPYQIVKNGNIKIGITAVSLPVKGAVCRNAIESANRTARFLKEHERCQLVICLSGLGPAKQNPVLNDQILAETSEHIDLIMGNDNGKPCNNDMVLHNKIKHRVIFSAAVSRGLTMGKTVITFDNEKRKQGISIEHIIPGKPADQKYGVALQELSLA